jgi:hypothetical protein
MKTDTYTKVVLTVIAACLVFNVASKLSFPAAYAQGKPVPSKVVRYKVRGINTEYIRRLGTMNPDREYVEVNGPILSTIPDPEYKAVYFLYAAE